VEVAQEGLRLPDPASAAAAEAEGIRVRVGSMGMGGGGAGRQPDVLSVSKVVLRRLLSPALPPSLLCCPAER
jgi:hypothetical protein